MARTLTILFRRDPSCDRQSEQVHFEGYQAIWPDGSPLARGVDALCKHGQRLLGLGKYLAGCQEKLINVVCFHLKDRDDDLIRIPGHRVRRFFIERQGETGRIHFLDGTPTTITFEIGRDEPKVIYFFGLASLKNGEVQWFDLAATEAETILAPEKVERRKLVGEKILS